MVFSSMTFLCAFLPLCAGLYYLSKNRIYRNAILLLFSLGFYAWGEPKYLILIAGATMAAYVGGIFMEKWRGGRKATFVCTLTTILLILCIAVFKYLGFLVDSVNTLTGADLAIRQIALPVGISFFTFQILSYVFDLYRGKVQVQKNPLRLLLYVSFFPQLIAGPIVRYETVELELRQRQENLDEITAGLRRFVVGLAKKVILADNVAKIFTAIYAGGAGGHTAYGSAAYWLASLSYTLHIYFDFSGYSDMAIGLGKMFGFHFLENFNFPYIAQSVTDFWRRWHMSLSTWFRDYIYIPMGGSRTQKWKHIRNILVVWALTGLWHGASWNFVLWGLYFAALLLLEKFLLAKVFAKIPALVRWLYTFLAVNVSWVMFHMTDFSQMGFALGKLFSFAPTDFTHVFLADSAIITALPYFLVALVFAFPVQNLWRGRERLPVAVKNLFTVLLLLLCLVYMLSTTFHPFIYFRF